MMKKRHGDHRTGVVNSISSTTIHAKQTSLNSTNSLLDHSTKSYLHPKQYLTADNSNLTLTNASMTSLAQFQVTNMPKHNLVVRNLKCKWNNVNRDVVFILYDIYNKSRQLRHNLSSQALKEYDLLTDQIVQNYLLNQQTKQQQQQQQQNLKKPGSGNTTNRNSYSPYSTVRSQKYSSSSSSSNQSAAAHFDLLNSSVDNTGTNSTGEVGSTPNDSNRHFEDLLNRLDRERATNLNIYCNEEPTNKSFNYFENFLYGLNSITKVSDMLSQNVSIELINSQVKLSLEDNELSSGVSAAADLTSNMSSNNLFNTKTKSTASAKKSSSVTKKGNEDYLIISAARANVVQCIHQPVWKSQRYLDKTSLSGYLENMQYFATLNTVKKGSASKNNEEKPSNDRAREDNNEYWLSDDIIDGSNLTDSPSNVENASSHNYIIDINGSKNAESNHFLFELINLLFLF